MNLTYLKISIPCLGKILRLNDDGTIPNDNPFPNSYVYSLGHRHPQGMTWDNNDNLFVAEFGPEKNDEINLILPGKNYGWPEQQCSGSLDFENAILCMIQVLSLVEFYFIQVIRLILNPNS